MQTQKDWPAVLILSAIRERPDGHRYVVAFKDGKRLHTQADLDARHGVYQALRRLGDAPYDYHVAHVDEADEALVDIRAQLEAEIANDKAESPPEPSASEPPSTTETDQDHCTTSSDEMQVVLTVRYEAKGAAVQPQDVAALGELVAVVDGDGNRVDRWAHSLAEFRLELKRRGFRPDYPEWRWLDRGIGPRRRREVWTGPRQERINPSLLRDTSVSREEVAARKARAEARKGPWPDPSRPDPFWRETWTRGRDWDLRGSLG